MAVQSTISSKKLALTVKTGVDEKGADVMKTVSFSKINMAATDDQLFNTANALAPLFIYGINEVHKNESFAMIGL